jgi:hypothetical protein
MDDDIPSGKITVMDQQSYFKIDTLRGITPTQIYESLREVCGDSTVDCSTISQWSQRFREGRIAVKDNQDRLQTTLQQSLLPKFWRKTGV